VVPSYAAPEVSRFQDARVGPATDVFHLAMFAYYWLARLLPAGGFLGAGLESFEYQVPPLRTYAPGMPPGIAVVLEHALATDPAQRFATVGEFCRALRAALDRAERRLQPGPTVGWEVGMHSLTGLAKKTLGVPNEDCGLVRSYTAPDRALVAVADGISICDVGNGAIASQIACNVVENVLGDDCRAESFEQQIKAACLQGARAMLDWARQRGHQTGLLAGQHLMATTLIVAWLEDNGVWLANLGDSRAYLIDDAGIDQLTVDGDLATSLLAAGAPPEEVAQLGPTGKALRECVGGCYRTPAGTLAIDEDRCRPAVCFWPLVPGDILVLCTDGLVEDGTYLEPAELADLVRQHRDVPAAVLAEKLAQAADARQRPPSEAEPEGFGDNITCAIIKIVRSP
jgi:serine/threonine protein phosphatase PrpC